MNVIPAIDLQEGQCVRLEKGRFDHVTHYKLDPVSLARQYEAAGARYLHIVDLDGAKNKRVMQLDSILKIKAATNLAIQVGGGIRTLDTVKRLLCAGIEKVVIGSMAINDIELTRSFLNEFGLDKFVLAFDVRIDKTNTPRIAIHGWQEESPMSLWEAIESYEAMATILCTDIEKDGMLTGPNLALYDECVKRYPHIAWQASGGVESLRDLQRLSEAGLSSTIVGKALFENKFTLTEALSESC